MILDQFWETDREEWFHNFFSHLFVLLTIRSVYLSYQFWNWLTIRNFLLLNFSPSHRRSLYRIFLYLSYWNLHPSTASFLDSSVCREILHLFFSPITFTSNHRVAQLLCFGRNKNETEEKKRTIALGFWYSINES